jgi:hypothetical protein
MADNIYYHPAMWSHPGAYPSWHWAGIQLCRLCLCAIRPDIGLSTVGYTADSNLPFAKAEDICQRCGKTFREVGNL